MLSCCTTKKSPTLNVFILQQYRNSYCSFITSNISPITSLCVSSLPSSAVYLYICNTALLCKPEKCEKSSSAESSLPLLPSPTKEQPENDNTSPAGPKRAQSNDNKQKTVLLVCIIIMAPVVNIARCSDQRSPEHVVLVACIYMSAKPVVLTSFHSVSISMNDLQHNGSVAK